MLAVHAPNHQYQTSRSSIWSASQLALARTLPSAIQSFSWHHIRETFAPTAANFFDRFARPYLNDLWFELPDFPEDQPNRNYLRQAENVRKNREVGNIIL